MKASEPEQTSPSTQPVTRPDYWGVDRDPTRRPGVPSHRAPKMWPNARWPIDRQPGQPSAPLHGRRNKRMTPVFSTAIPMKGVSGAIRKLAYRAPDHKPRYWMLKLLADRVESWGYHTRKYGVYLVPLVALALFVRDNRAPQRLAH